MNLQQIGYVCNKSSPNRMRFLGLTGGNSTKPSVGQLPLLEFNWIDSTHSWRGLPSPDPAWLVVQVGRSRRQKGRAAVTVFTANAGRSYQPSLVSAEMERLTAVTDHSAVPRPPSEKSVESYGTVIRYHNGQNRSKCENLAKPSFKSWPKFQQ